MKRYLAHIVLLVALVMSIALQPVMAQDLRGRILLAVTEHGEAWYVSPIDGLRYSLGRPSEALAVFRRLGLGVKHEVINNPPKRLSGRILLDVEDAGKAYYYSPVDQWLYYLGRPDEALAVMKKLGLGVDAKTLSSFTVGGAITNGLKVTSAYAEMEKVIQELVNDQRQQHGLTRLKWNDQLAAVAREHSQDQANENVGLISQSKYCSYPFIHHEGMVFGLYHSDRLQTRGVYYQSASAENIALIPKIKSVQFNAVGAYDQDCQAEVKELNTVYEEEVKALSTTSDKLARLRKEFVLRAGLLKQSQSINVVKNFYNDVPTVEAKAVDGWMNSPGHRRNILNPEYDEAGMGIAEVNGYYIITQVFIKRATCGFKGGACCQKSGYLPYCYVPWMCSENSMCL